MEEVIAELREACLSIPIPLSLPDADELVVIEEEILISLPFEYRTFLLEVSDVVFGSLEPATAADPNSHTHLPEMTALAWDRGLPREYIPICEASGAYYCIAQDGEITLWRDGNFTDDEWETIWHWARDVWLKS